MREEESKKKYDEKTIFFIGDIIDFTLSEEKEEDKKKETHINFTIGQLVSKPITKRKENYDGGIGTNDLFNFESKLQEVKGRYHGKNREFCEKFNLSERESGMKHSGYWGQANVT